MSLALITSLMTETITVKRRAAGAWTSGVFVPGAETEIQMVASVQPLRANEILQLPEHRRTREAMKVFTHERLHTTDEKAQTPGDVVLHDGKRFEVHSVENWQIGTALPHYKSVLVKQDGEGGGV